MQAVISKEFEMKVTYILFLHIVLYFPYISSSILVVY